MKKMRTRAPWWEFRPLLLALEPFQCYGNMHAVRVSGESTVVDAGHLDPAQAGAFNLALNESAIDYVVYSYATPIAWHFKNGRWYVPGVRYSRTTSQHQSRIRAALHDDVGVERVIRDWPAKAFA